eukprot:3342236-Pleurochrysis_carterae.AAC.1
MAHGAARPRARIDPSLSACAPISGRRADAHPRAASLPAAGGAPAPRTLDTTPHTRSLTLPSPASARSEGVKLFSTS